jgi:hypothetical protein
MKSVKVPCIVVLLAGVLGLSATACWSIYIKPALLLKRAKYFQMTTIANAIRSYNERHTRPPAEIGDLVRDGLLPGSSSIYACTLKYRSLCPPELQYSQSDYEINVEGDGVRLGLKPAAYKDVARGWKGAVGANTLSAWVGNGERLRPPESNSK